MHFIKDTPFLALISIKRRVGVYFGSPFDGYALNFFFVYLTILGTRLLSIIKQRGGLTL